MSAMHSLEASIPSIPLSPEIDRASVKAPFLITVTPPSLQSVNAIAQEALEHLEKSKAEADLHDGLRVTAESKPRKSSISVKIGQETILLPLAERRAVQLPREAQDKLNLWLDRNEAAQAVSNPGRISYSREQIIGALRTFEQEYECSWHTMKHRCTDKQILQIINDLRSAYLEEIFSTLKTEFPTLKKISDFGSSKLTSDRDFAFEVGSDQQAKEAEVVSRFNDLFEHIWNMPSSVVFDSNAYTMQYTLSANDPDIENKRSQMQGEGSLLMKLRTSTPKSWEIFKSETLKRITRTTLREAKLAEFTRVEIQNANLHSLLNKEILKLEMARTGTDLNISKLSESEIAKAAAAIKENNPHLEIQASNALHEYLKTSYHSIEKHRNALFSTLRNLEESSFANLTTEFTTTFNSQTNRLIMQLKQSLDKEKNPMARTQLQARIAHLENSRIEAGEEKDVMTAFKNRTRSEKAIKETHQQLVLLQSQKKQFQQLTSQLDVLTTKLAHSRTAGDATTHQQAITKVQEELNKLKASLGAKVNSEVTHLIDAKLAELTPKLRFLKEENEKLADELGEHWDKAGVLGIESDRMLMQMQQLNLKGMCFAQEAHVSEGAFAFVVLNIQAGRSEVRTPNQYVQAFREISGYYSGHQVHQSTPHGKMVESSKYADRLIKTLELVKERAGILGLPGPKLEDVTKMERFFTGIAPLRGTGKSDTELFGLVEREARASGLIEARIRFDEAVVDKINEKVENLSASLEEWLISLPEKNRNAYYAI